MALSSIPTATPTRAPALDPLDVVDRVEKAIYDLDRLVRSNPDNPDVLVACAEVAHEAGTVSKQVHDDAERLVINYMGPNIELELANGDVVEMYSDPKEVYDDELVRDALTDIVKQHAFSAKTGEMHLDPDHAGEVVDLVLAVMTKTKPKKQALKAHRINPLRLIHTERGEPKLRLVHATPAEKVSHLDATMVRGGEGK